CAACSASLVPAQERGWPWSVRWNSSRRTRSRSPRWSTISSGDHLPGAIGRLAFAIESPWIAALTAARARASSNRSSSRDEACARWVANAGVTTWRTAAAGAGSRRTPAGRGAAVRRVTLRCGAALRLGAARFTRRFAAVARASFFFAGARRLAPARGLPERALLALRPALFRLDCFFPAARATRCPRSAADPAEAGAATIVPVECPGSDPRATFACGASAARSGRDGVRHRRILVHPAAALPAQSAGGHVLLDQRTGAELLAQRPVQEAKDGEPRVEPDQIHQLERPHRMVQAQLQRLVDVGGARHAL